jgi:hypothetical protein
MTTIFDIHSDYHQQHSCGLLFLEPKHLKSMTSLMLFNVSYVTSPTVYDAKRCLPTSYLILTSLDCHSLCLSKLMRIAAISWKYNERLLFTNMGSQNTAIMLHVKGTSKHSSKFYTHYFTKIRTGANFFLWRCGPTKAMASSFMRFLDHTQRHITVGTTPLDEWSAPRRDIYLTTHNTQNRQT